MDCHLALFSKLLNTEHSVGGESTKDCFKLCCFTFDTRDNRVLTRRCVHSCAENQHVVFSAPKGQLQHWPVNHIDPQQNAFITVDSVSFV